MAKKQFAPMDCSRGAPMGRAEFGNPAACEGNIRLYRVVLDKGGYDDGGAYWGGGGDLYCAEGDNYRRFTRACCREGARRGLHIPPEKLKYHGYHSEYHCRKAEHRPKTLTGDEK